MPWGGRTLGGRGVVGAVELIHQQLPWQARVCTRTALARHFPRVHRGGWRAPGCRLSGRRRGPVINEDELSGVRHAGVRGDSRLPVVARAGVDDGARCTGGPTTVIQRWRPPPLYSTCTG